MADRYSACSENKEAKSQRVELTSTSVLPLPVLCRRVVRPVEELCNAMGSVRIHHAHGEIRTNELAIAHNARVKLYPQCLGVVGRPSADSGVVRVLRILLPACVSNRRLQDSLVLSNRIVLQKNVLYAPEASCGERCNLRCLPCSTC